jgi:hypothetical protein
MTYVRLPSPLVPLPNVEVFRTWNLDDGTTIAEFYRCDDEYIIHFPDRADFKIFRDTGKVGCWINPGARESVAQQIYRNQVLPLAHSQQGKLVFHASVVKIDGCAVAFMGRSGAGKSTLATAFATNGNPFLTEDGMVLCEQVDGFQVLPSDPSVRLLNDSKAALISAQAESSIPSTEKSRVFADMRLRHCDQPTHLRQIYLLGSKEGSGISIERLGCRDAMLNLVQHAFVLDLESKQMRADHFRRLGRLLARVECFQLNYPRRYSALEEVRSTVIANVSAS